MRAALVAGMALVALGCEGKGDGDTAPQAATVAPTAMGESKVTEAPATSAAPGAGIAPVGITDCDAYIAKVNECFARDPDLKAKREAANQGMAAKWRRAVPTNRDAVATSCARALATIGVIMPTCR